MYYYVDSTGKYMGGYSDPVANAGWVEVPAAPYDGLSIWDGTGWVESAERKRLNAKETRDEALNAITHTFADGRVVQVRPEDVANFQIAIARGTAHDWALADNSVAQLTVAEMQAALDSGIAQGEVIWQAYVDVLKGL